MLKCRHVYVILSMLFFASCAATDITVKDPIGRELPDPHYVLKGIDTPITVMFYYTAFQNVTDVDGSVIQRPTFLDLYKFHNLDINEYETITLTMEIHNPENLKYSLYQKIAYEKGDMRDEYEIGGLANQSNLPYRQFVYNLPTGEDIKFACHSLSLGTDNGIVMQMGPFQYNLIH
jgi:hypothetical protein